MKDSLEAAIRSVITDAMKRVVVRALEEDPFDGAHHEVEKPLHAALVPEDIFKGSHFERRFVTIFGRVWEELLRAVGASRFGWAATQHRIDGQIKQGCLERIQRILDQLEHGRRDDGQRVRPNWEQELAYAKGGAGEWQDVSVNCDVFVSTSREAPGLAFELKAAQPNSDQTKVSKEKLLKLHCMEPCGVTAAYFALPYNPYGEKKLYSWSFPMRWFDMRNDECVLIGDELWDRVGGTGTYDEIIRIAREVGLRHRERIRDYMNPS